MINPLLPQGVQGGPPVRDVSKTRPPAQVQRVADASAVTPTQAGSVPSTPPPEVLHALNKAAQVLDDLAAKQINLHFEVDDQTNDVRVQVRDADGKVVREIPPRRLLDILSGSPSGGLVFDAVG